MKEKDDKETAAFQKEAKCCPLQSGSDLEFQDKIERQLTKLQPALRNATSNVGIGQHCQHHKENASMVTIQEPNTNLME